MSAGVNPDAALFAFWTVAFWLGARILRRGLTVRDGVAMGLVVGTAVTAKSASWGLFPATLLVLAVGWRRLRAGGLPRPGRPLAASLAALAVPAGAWVLLAKLLDRSVANSARHHEGIPTPRLTSLDNLHEFASYLWQFYLPRLPFQHEFFGMGDGGHAVYDRWLKTGWAAFGWLEVRLPEWSYSLLGIASAALILGGLTALVRAHRRRAVDPALVGFLLLAATSLLLIVHWADYTFIKVERHSVEQGRYLLPLVSLGGLAAAGGVSLLRRRWQAPAVGVLVAALVTLQLASLGVTMERYFA
jgi:predicted membrane protein DUF2142